MLFFIFDVVAMYYDKDTNTCYVIKKPDECAKRLIGKYNIVTLDGEFFHKSGLMLGGYILNLDTELNYYKTQIKEIKSKLKVLEKQKGLLKC